VLLHQVDELVAAVDSDSVAQARQEARLS
jgi:hypothetical protein